MSATAWLIQEIFFNNDYSHTARIGLASIVALTPIGQMLGSPINRAYNNYFGNKNDDNDVKNKKIDNALNIINQNS